MPRAKRKSEETKEGHAKKKRGAAVGTQEWSSVSVDEAIPSKLKSQIWENEFVEFSVLLKPKEYLINVYQWEHPAHAKFLRL